jgi:hypothetical protein
MRVRRLVTAHDAEGRSVFGADSELEPITAEMLPGTEFFQIWGSDQPLRLPIEQDKPNELTWFPPAGGCRFAIIRIEPETVTAAAQGASVSEASLDEVRTKLSGLLDVVEQGSELHATATVDFVVLLSGELWLELEDGAERLVRAGECVVQTGTRHTWRNRSTEACVMAVVIVGASRG